MELEPQQVLIIFAVIAAIIFLAGVGYTVVQFRKMEKRPENFEGSDPESHYRR